MEVRELVISPPPDSPRAGLHLSTLIKYLLMRQDPKRYGGAPTDAARWGWELGFAWEDVALGRALLPRVAHRFLGDRGMRRLDRQCVRERDGIRGTVDAVDARARCIYECKLTDLSDAPITDSRFRAYHWQGMGYAHLWGYERVIYLICHVRGDYREERGRIVRAWDVQYSAREIEKNWRMLLNAKADMEEERVKG